MAQNRLTTSRSKSVIRLSTARLHHVRLLAPIVAMLFFLMGYFDFLDVFGVRLFVLAPLLAFTVILGVPVLSFRRTKFLREPLFWLAVVFMLTEPVFRRGPLSINAAVGLSTAMFLMVIIFTLGRDFATRTLKWLIAIAGIFAALAVLQFAILLQYPELTQHTVNPNYVEFVDGLGGSRQFLEMSGRDFVVDHPIALLGMTTGEKSFFGMRATRVFSFAREPGLVLFYFFLPGVLALTFKGTTRLWSLPLLALSFLSFSGTVYGSLAISIILLIVGSVMSLHGPRRALSLTPLFLAIAGFVFVSSTAMAQGLLERVFQGNAFASFQENFGFLDFSASAMLRLEQRRQALSVLGPFGVGSDGMLGAVGLLGYGFVRAHLFGAAIALGFLYTVFKAATDYVVAHKRGIIVWALICGIFIEAGFFQQYGLTLPSGLLLSSLTLERLRVFGEARGEKGSQIVFKRPEDHGA